MANVHIEQPFYWRETTSSACFVCPTVLLYMCLLAFCSSEYLFKYMIWFASHSLPPTQCLYIYLLNLFTCRGSEEIILKRCNSSFFNISHIIADENNYSLQVLHHLPTLQTRLAIIGDYINLCRRLARQRPVQHKSPRTHTHTAGTREEAVGRGEGPWEAVR